MNCKEILLALILIALLPIATFGQNSESEKDREIKRLKEKIRQLEKKVKDLKKRLEEFEDQKGEGEVEWWKKRGNIALKGYGLTVSASARTFGNRAVGRRMSETRAKRNLAAFIQKNLKDVAQNLEKKLKGLVKRGSLTKKFQDNLKSRQIIQGTIRGARPLIYRTVATKMYVLMGIPLKEMMKSMERELWPLVEESLTEGASKKEARKIFEEYLQNFKEMVQKENKYDIDKGRVVPVK